MSIEKSKKVGRQQTIHLERAKSVDCIRILKRMISHRNYETRVAALEAMGDCEWELDLEGHVRRAIHDRDELVRVTAVELAGDFTMKGMQLEIVRLMESDDSCLVRSAAAQALGNMSASETQKVLEKQVRRVDDFEKVALYYALVKLGARKYKLSFLNGLRHESHLIRGATANLMRELVGELGKSSVTRLLTEALKRETTVSARSSIENTLKKVATDKT
jgi:HEAT repeat protein